MTTGNGKSDNGFSDHETVDGQEPNMIVPPPIDMNMINMFADSTIKRLDDIMNEIFERHGMGRLGGASGRGWSSHSTFQKCPYLFKLTYLEGQRGSASSALETGSAFHTFLALHYKWMLDENLTLTPYVARDEMLNGGGDAKAILEAWRLYEAYVNKYENDYITPIAMEEWAQDPDGNTCRYDLIGEVTNAQPGVVPGVYIIEHKTAARFTADALEGWRNDGEILGQIMIWKRGKLDKKYGKLRGVIVNIVGKQKVIQFHRTIVPAQKWHVQQHMEDLKMWAALQQMYAATGVWPKARANCVTKFGLCVAEGTPVYLYPSLEPRPIEQIKVGDRVLTHEGNGALVTTTMKRPFEGELVQITSLGAPSPLRVTEDHLIYAANRIRWTETCKDYPGHGRFVTNPPVWTAAADLRDRRHRLQNHATVLPRLGTDAQPWAHFPKTQGVFLRDRPIDESFARLIGYYVAEGNKDTPSRTTPDRYYRSQFTFNIREEHLHQEVRDAVETLFALPVATEHNQEAHSTTLRIANVALSTWFVENCGALAEEKRFPDDLTIAPLPILREAVRAAWLGDGGVARFKANPTKRCMSMGTTSKTLMHQLRFALLRFGITATLHDAKPRPGRLQVHVLVVHGAAATALAELLRIDPWSEAAPAGHLKLKVLENGDMGLPIKRVERVPYIGHVYDLEVAGVHSFVTPAGVVHNCSFFDHCAENQKLVPIRKREWKPQEKPSIAAATESQEGLAIANTIRQTSRAQTPDDSNVTTTEESRGSNT
jgi:hypothetical protein